jgi:predicted small lipoprotein YifL
MQEVVAVAPNHSYFVLLRVIHCSLWACGLRGSLKCPLRAM